MIVLSRIFPAGQALPSGAPAGAFGADALGQCVDAAGNVLDASGNALGAANVAHAGASRCAAPVATASWLPAGAGWVLAGVVVAAAAGAGVYAWRQHAAAAAPVRRTSTGRARRTPARRS